MIFNEYDCQEVDMADSPDLFSFIGDWSAAADQFLATSIAVRLQIPFNVEEREIIRLMLHGSVRPPEGLGQSLIAEAETFNQRAMEECERRYRMSYAGPLRGHDFLSRLNELKSVAQSMVSEVASLRDFGSILQDTFPEEDDVRITREFPSGIFITMDEHHVSEVETGCIEVASEAVPVPTIPAPKAYPEPLKPQAGKQSGLHHFLSDKPGKT